MVVNVLIKKARDTRLIEFIFLSDRKKTKINFKRIREKDIYTFQIQKKETTKL